MPKKKKTMKTHNDDDFYTFARITDESGDFNETCDVTLAEKLLEVKKLTSFDGTDHHGYCQEHYYTVVEEHFEEVLAAIEKEQT